MTERIRAELTLLQNRFPRLDFLEEGLWCRLPDYVVPGDHWREELITVAFRIPPSIPGQEPYGFWVAGGITPRQPGAVMTNYVYPVEIGFGGEWGQFSWAPERWHPGPTAPAGDNMVSWIATFAHRLLEGP